VANLIPFTWGLTSLRATLLFGQLQTSRFAGIVLTAVVAMPLVLLVFGRAVDRARRGGTLGQY
jgi:hypothetical protein